MSISTILVGVDDSQGSRAALRWAADLAAQLSARVVLLHVYEPLAHLGELAPGTNLHDLREQVQKTLRDELAGELRSRGIAHEVQVREGVPSETLVRVADEVEADLVVVGARRMGALKSLVLGSTSASLARSTARPVVVVHA